MIIAILVIAIIDCIILSACFSASEMAYSSCNTVRLENIHEEKTKGWKLAGIALKITGNFDNALSAILIGNNLVNIAASSLSSVFVIVLMGNDSYTWLSTIILTILVVIFGETIPKIYAKKYSTTLSMRFAPFIRFLMILFTPVIAIVVGLVRLLTFWIKKEKEDGQEESVEELQSIIETAEDEGIIDKDDSSLMQAAIDFADISASEVMTARVDVHAIDIDDPWSEIIKSIEESPYSRIPVYRESIDNIVGILHLNTVFKALTDQEETGTPIDLTSLLMPPCYVYKTMKMPQVLSTLKAAKQHLAIVT